MAGSPRTTKWCTPLCLLVLDYHHFPCARAPLPSRTANLPQRTPNTNSGYDPDCCGEKQLAGIANKVPVCHGHPFTDAASDSRERAYDHHGRSCGSPLRPERAACSNPLKPIISCPCKRAGRICASFSPFLRGGHPRLCAYHRVLAPRLPRGPGPAGGLHGLLELANRCPELVMSTALSTPILAE